MSQGEGGGRPPKFEDVETLDNLIESYFEKLIQKNKKGEIINVDCPTITGLALHLGFCDKSSIYDYQKKEKFSYSIKRARLMVEEGYEKALMSKNATGAIFGLKNFGWSNEPKAETTTNDIIVKRATFEDE